MISKFFIDRPVFASVLSIVIVLAGLVSMRVLPISQYPQIVPPDVVVNANYPGATAETMRSENLTRVWPVFDQRSEPAGGGCEVSGSGGG